MNAASQRNTATATRGDSPDSSREGQSQEGPGGARATGGQVDGPWTDVSNLVLCARCEMAMARVEGPLNVQASYAHARAAQRWARHAGASALPGSPVPLMFKGAPTLIDGWLAGQFDQEQAALHRIGAAR